MVGNFKTDTMGQDAILCSFTSATQGRSQDVRQMRPNFQGAQGHRLKKGKVTGFEPLFFGKGLFYVTKGKIFIKNGPPGGPLAQLGWGGGGRHKSVKNKK